MSSILENNNKMENKITERKINKFFLRSSSFEKLCLARYPLKMTGIKINKNGIIELLEKTIIKARILSLKALIMFIMATFKMVNVIFSICSGASANSLVCEKDQKTNITTAAGAYCEKFKIKLNKLQKSKIRLESSLQNSVEPSALSTNSIRQISENNNEENLLKKNQFNAEIAKIRSLSTENLSQKSVNYEKIYLFPIVYGCIIFLHLQVLFLAFQICELSFPIGYIFLIGSLVLITVITYQVFLTNRNGKLNAKTIRSPKSEKHKKSSPITELTNKILADDCEKHQRQSRNRLKRAIDLNSKTLSKIKLL